MVQSDSGCLIGYVLSRLVARVSFNVALRYEARHVLEPYPVDEELCSSILVLRLKFPSYHNHSLRRNHCSGRD